MSEISKVAKAHRDPYDLIDSPISPKHYKDYHGFEVIDITEQLDFCLGNVVKYTLRAGKKDGNTKVQDLQKAEWYLQRVIKGLER